MKSVAYQSGIALLAGLFILGIFGLTRGAAKPQSHPAPAHFAVVKTDAQWRRLLTPEQFDVMRRHGTEPPFSGKYDNFFQKGVYQCAACGNPIFRSDAKYNPHEGWPSFWQPLSKNSVITQPDHSLGMDRTEVLCARCGAHLGHLFNDGPRPTGLRYCIDSAALKFVPKS